MLHTKKGVAETLVTDIRDSVKELLLTPKVKVEGKVRSEYPSSFNEIHLSLFIHYFRWQFTVLHKHFPIAPWSEKLHVDSFNQCIIRQKRVNNSAKFVTKYQSPYKIYYLLILNDCLIC